jgi:hypothetical protein
MRDRPLTCIKSDKLLVRLSTSATQSVCHSVEVRSFGELHCHSNPLVVVSTSWLGARLARDLSFRLGNVSAQPTDIHGSGQMNGI